MEEQIINFPRLMLSFKQKSKKWRKLVLDFCDTKTFQNSSLVRRSTRHKKINYDLINGKLHMNDLLLVLNPDGIQAKYLPTEIQHYPIINTKLEVLLGEELSRVFDYRVIVTNPNAISEIEERKKQEILQRLLEEILNTSASEEEFNQRVQKLNLYFTYEYLDNLEVKANSLLNHYWKELNMPNIFHKGFIDAEAVGEELYLCDVVSGEPTIIKLNPMKVRILSSGYSNKAEDADMIILEDYWSPGRIIDTYYDSLTESDIKKIEEMPTATYSAVGPDGLEDSRAPFIFVGEDGVEQTTEQIESMFNEVEDYYSASAPYDFHGNIKVLRVYWKSKRKVKKVKQYDPETGEVIYTLMPETYQIDPLKGEEETIMWINEAWEGTKIGKDIYVNIRPRPILYNRMSNPSRCHFGIVGTIYNLNDGKPFSMVDRMKPYNYLYDVVHDRLNKLIARNWGKMTRLDMAKVPEGWDIDKWMYFARTQGLFVENTMNEVNHGPLTGKVVGALNNNSNAAIDADLGNAIQLYINLLQFINMELADIVGISKLREGQISNRETVGGVERATLLSSHITEWIFANHNDTKKRAIECFLETAKIALKGKKMKFLYILPDFTVKAVDLDGDEFASCDYGLVVDASQGAQELNQKIDMLAQAALLNQLLDFSTIMKLYLSCSIAEKVRMVSDNEAQLKQAQQLLAQQQLQAQQEQQLALLQQKQLELEQQAAMNSENNETKIVVAQIAADALIQKQIEQPDNSEEAKLKLMLSMKEFDAKLQLERLKLEHLKTIDNKKLELEKQKINKQKVSK